MGKIKDRRTMNEMTKTIDRYLAGRRDFMTLVQTLERGTRSLDSGGADWKTRIFEEWIELEIVYSLILERDELNMVSTEKEESIIRDTLLSIREILCNISDLIEERFCPSCGADLSDSCVWCKTENSNDTCYCCGLGFDRQPSVLEAVRAARDRWLAHPEFWKEPGRKPDDWKIEDQMSNIPSEYL
jgi:hypothetical protein